VLIATAAATGSITYQPLAALPFSATQHATYTDSLNQRVTVSLKGLGSGNVVFIGTTSNATNAFEIVTNGTNSASNLTVSVAGGRQTSLNDLVVNGSIGTIAAKSVNLLSSLSATGSINAITLGYVAASTLTIGGTATTQSVGLAFNRVLNSNINSAIPIRSLTAGAYLNTTGSPVYITAPSVGKVSIKGDFGATIKAASVASLSVTGLINGGGILANNSIGSVTAGGIVGSQIFAGVNSGQTTLPTAAINFSSEQASIGSVRVNGGLFSNSQIAAWDIGGVILAQVPTVVGGANFGISTAHLASIRTGLIGTHKGLSVIDPTNTSIDNFVILSV
jgi:hypothetical protein